MRETERTLDASDRAAFRAGAGEGVAEGFSTVLKGMGVFALLAALGWVALLRPRRGPPGAGGSRSG